MIFGLGAIQRMLETRYPDLPVVAYADNNPEKQGTQYRGKPVMAPENIRDIWSDDMAIVVGTSQISAISQQLDALGFELEREYFDGADFLSDEEFRETFRLDPDMENDFIRIYQQCRKFTMTSAARMYALYNAIRYVSDNRIPGDIVECGVWKGGSCMLAALTLLHLGDTDRTIYLYDTFAGMSTPEDVDLDFQHNRAKEEWEKHKKGNMNLWCYSPLEAVRQNMLSTGYPAERLVFVQGKVEETIPGTMPSGIALLKLDTDWYASTRHELDHLYPVLSEQGVLIIDDYGYWQGARRAVDDYFADHPPRPLLHKIDFSGRVGIKPAGVR